MGHIGYTPQFKKKFKVEGASMTRAKKLLNEAKLIEKAGADRFSFADTVGVLHPNKVRDIFSILAKEINIPIILWDERLSTVGSFNLSSQLDINVSKRLKNIDQNSASFILQGALDYLMK